MPPSVFAVVAKFAAGWKISNCGPDMEPRLRAEWGGKKNVLLKHPLDPETPCILSCKLKVPAGEKPCWALSEPALRRATLI